jgi:hypothetical protein
MFPSTQDFLKFKQFNYLLQKLNCEQALKTHSLYKYKLKLLFTYNELKTHRMYCAEL